MTEQLHAPKMHEPFEALRGRTESIPEIATAIGLAETDPTLTSGLVARYEELLGFMAMFGEEEIDTARIIRESLLPQQGEFSASKARLIDVYVALGENYHGFMSELFTKAMDIDIEDTKDGLSDFIERLEGGHRLKVEGHTIYDGDEMSDSVIWGHTLIKDPEAMLHFLFIHYIERVACAEMRSEDIALGSEKDFFLNGMIDAILIDDHRQFDDLYQILNRKREDNGVGWKLGKIEALISN